MIKEVNYNNLKKINRFLKTVFLAIDSEGYIGVFDKKFENQISIVPFPDTYELKNFEIA